MGKYAYGTCQKQNAVTGCMLALKNDAENTSQNVYL